MNASVDAVSSSHRAHLAPVTAPELVVREGMLDVPGEVSLYHGGRLPGIRIAWRLAGPANAPVICALGGISANRRVFVTEDLGHGSSGPAHEYSGLGYGSYGLAHESSGLAHGSSGLAHGSSGLAHGASALAHGSSSVVHGSSGPGHASSGRAPGASGSRQGWWSEVVGPGRALDVTRFRVLSFDYLGGSGETTGPLSINSAAGSANAPTEHAHGALEQPFAIAPAAAGTGSCTSAGSASIRSTRQNNGPDQLNIGPGQQNIGPGQQNYASGRQTHGPSGQNHGPAGQNDGPGGQNHGPVRQTNGPAFPNISTYDQAELLVRLLNNLGLKSLRAIVGGSYGGMVALAFGERYPERVSQLIVIGAPDRPHPMATAWRSVQRQILRFSLQCGRPKDGLKLARALAMSTYRSAEEFKARFDGAPTRDGDRHVFPVEQYIFSRGNDFADKHSAEAILCLSESIDLHRVDAARIFVPTTIVAVREDQLVPLADLRGLAARLPSARLHEISSIYGHDAFLKESDQLRGIFAAVLGGAA